jgi:hypothetical protein
LADVSNEFLEGSEEKRQVFETGNKKKEYTDGNSNRKSRRG